MITLVALLFVFSVCQTQGSEPYVLFGPLNPYKNGLNSYYCESLGLISASFPDYATLKEQMNEQAKKFKGIGIALITVVDKNSKVNRFWWNNDPYNKAEFDSKITGADTPGIYYHYVDLANDPVIKNAKMGEEVYGTVTGTICLFSNHTQPQTPKWKIDEKDLSTVTGLDQVCDKNDAIVPNLRTLQLLFQKAEKDNGKEVAKIFLPLKYDGSVTTWKNGSSVEDGLLSIITPPTGTTVAFTAEFSPAGNTLSITTGPYGGGTQGEKAYVLCTES
ncbi:unnamed protein product [Bursaphelenchus xylophilus]|uniref:(pine wood nematode) hypothetical protein n=1 Tax=Bursaphelenchus xylophilus TaxID=6326 RepID=A0A1I7RK03_BURXY|nr:unnamed protein product [Bursaphelenchus xylophilus]CAG9131603.1 unnamed protein product [Bursaphelenchus xylophilus]